MDKTILTILIISIAGPIIGSLIGVLKKPSMKFMYNLLSFAGGVMLAVSFLNLIPMSLRFSSVWIAVFGIIIGSCVMFCFDRLIPHIHPELCSQEQGCQIKRTAIYLLIGIFLHNFPEGMAIGIGMLSDIKESLIIALAIAIHDIPEGICTSAPYYYCTKKRLKSFLFSSSTILPTLVGFIISGFFFKYLPSNVLGLIMGATAGLMIYITADELIPASCSKTTDHTTIFSLILGIISVIIIGLL